MKNELININWVEEVTNATHMQDCRNKFHTLMIQKYVPQKKKYQSSKKSSGPGRQSLNASETSETCYMEKKTLNNGKCEENGKITAMLETRWQIWWKNCKKNYETKTAMNVKDNPKVAIYQIKIQWQKRSMKPTNPRMTSTNREKANALSNCFSTVCLQKPDGPVSELKERR